MHKSFSPFDEVSMGRPRRQIDTIEVLRLRLEERLSWPQISRRMRLGYGTTFRAYRAAIEALHRPNAVRCNLACPKPQGEGFMESTDSLVGKEVAQ